MSSALKTKLPVINTTEIEEWGFRLYSWGASVLRVDSWEIMTQRREVPCARTPGNAAGMAYLGGKVLSLKAKEFELQSQPVSLRKAQSTLRERHCSCSP